jgi:hypothetical protein
MGSIIKVNEYKDFGNNAIMTSDGAGTLTLNNSALKNTPSFYVYKNAVQAIANNVETVVTWTTERFDTNSAFASNTFTVPANLGGKYLFNAGIRWNSASDFEGIRFTLRTNSSNFSSTWGRNEYYQTQQITSVLDLSATDTVDLVCKQSSGGSIDLGEADQGDISWFQGFKLT